MLSWLLVLVLLLLELLGLLLWVRRVLGRSLCRRTRTR